MTDTIEEMYLDRASRLIGFNDWSEAKRVCMPITIDSIRAHAATLKELGWKPPIDEARMAKARKVAAAVLEGWGLTTAPALIRAGQECDNAEVSAIQSAYDALGED